VSCLLADVDVGSDFHGEADFFKLRLDPCIHSYLLAGTDISLFSPEKQEIFGLKNTAEIKFSP
jgi:hypothetical protein